MVMNPKKLSQKFKYLFMTEMDIKDFKLENLDIEFEDPIGYTIHTTFDYLMDVDPNVEDISWYLGKAAEAIEKFASKYQYDKDTDSIIDKQKYQVGPNLVFGLDFEWGTKFVVNIITHVNY